MKAKTLLSFLVDSFTYLKGNKTLLIHYHVHFLGIISSVILKKPPPKSKLG
jgi:hypothetical protein